MGTPNFLHFILIFIITYTFPKACTFSVFLFLNGCTRGIWKFLGQGLNPKCSCTTTAVAMSMSDPLTHCARPGIEPLSPKLPEPPMVRFFFFFLMRAVVVAAAAAEGGCGLHFQPMEVSRPVVESELQLLATATARSELRLTYTTGHGNARSLTPWARPGIEPASSWILVGFFPAEPPWELLQSDS